MTHLPVPGQIQLRPRVRKEKGWHLSSGKRTTHSQKTPYFTPIVLVIFLILLLDRKLICESDSCFSILRPLNKSLCWWTLSFGFDFWLGDNEWRKHPLKARGSEWSKLVTTLSIRQSKIIAPNVDVRSELWADFYAQQLRHGNHHLDCMCILSHHYFAIK